MNSTPTIPPTRKPSSRQIKVDTIFKPNSSGVSEWVAREHLNGTDLELTSNGNCRNGIFFGDKRYTWEKYPIGTKRLERLRTTGFSDDKLYGSTRPIRPDIATHHKKMGCVVCGSGSDLVTDHKNDLYNDPRVLSSHTQTLDDFQCLCNHCNLVKREVAVATRRTGKRYGATQIPSMNIFGIDFVAGDETFDPLDINAMTGTFWHDPVEFKKRAFTMAFNH